MRPLWSESREFWVIQARTAAMLRDGAGMEVEEWHPAKKEVKRVSDGRMRLEPYEAKFYITK